VQCAARLPASLIMHVPITDLHGQWHFDFNWLNIVIKIFLVTAEWIKGIVVVVIVWLLDLQLPMQSVLITTNVVNSHLAHVFDTTLCDKVCQWLAAGRWFSLGTPISSINKTDRNDITEILLKVILNTITLTLEWINLSQWIDWLKNALISMLNV
jgi:hypothetical protein